MNISTNTPCFQIEHLLQSYGEALAAKRDGELSVRSTRIDRRSMLAGFLAILVFAPGCATATVLLMQTEKRLPAVTAPQPAIKSDRMPLSRWKASAPARTAASAEQAAPVSNDIVDLEPLAIRGTLGEQPTAAATDAAAPAVAAAAPARPKRRHAPSRAKPLNLVAEAVVPEAAPPSFFEKLFALRTL